MTLVLGLDIGGTYTRGRLVRDGEQVDEVKVGSASLTAAGREKATEAVHELLDGLSLEPGTLDAVCAGSAGSGSADAEAFLHEHLTPLTSNGTVLVVNDVRLVLAAAGLDDGIAVVAGTGSNCVGVLADREEHAGGWGWLVGDEGSAYWVAREAVREVLRREQDHQGLGPLGETLLEAVGVQDARDLLQLFYDEPGPEVWGRHAGAVLKSTDEYVATILIGAADELAMLAVECGRRLEAPHDLPVALAGGLLTGHKPLAQATIDRLAELRPDSPVTVVGEPPVAGAVRLAEAAASSG